MSGKFITFEGGEGAGKSTQARRLADWLKEKGVDVVLTREPGGTEGGDAIRALLMTPDVALTPIAEALLFAAARAEHVERVIRPALERGAWVVSDRFLDSSLAYQGGAGGLGVDRVVEINAPAVDNLAPDLTLYLRTDPETGRARAAARDGAEADRFAARDEAFHGAVVAAFETLLERSDGRIVAVDAQAQQDDVAKAIRAIVGERLL